MERHQVQRWLDAYVDARKRFDPQAMIALFASDVVYYQRTPWAEPLRGQAALVAAWLAAPDPPDTWDAYYLPIAIDGAIAVAHGYTQRYARDGVTLQTEWNTLLVLRFDEAERCAEWREWHVKRPAPADRSAYI